MGLLMFCRTKQDVDKCNKYVSYESFRFQDSTELGALLVPRTDNNILTTHSVYAASDRTVKMVLNGRVRIHCNRFNRLIKS